MGINAHKYSYKYIGKGDRLITSYDRRRTQNTPHDNVDMRDISLHLLMQKVRSRRIKSRRILTWDLRIINRFKSNRHYVAQKLFSRRYSVKFTDRLSS